MFALVIYQITAHAVPTATNDNASTPVNTPLLIDVLQNDSATGGSSLAGGTVNLVRPYRRGIFAQRDGKINYSPQPGFAGDEIFRYTVQELDGLGVFSSPSTPATLTVTVNGNPTNIQLSDDTVSENLPAGSAVGTFASTDPNAGDSHSYTLVTGVGDGDQRPVPNRGGRTEDHLGVRL